MKENKLDDFEYLKNCSECASTNHSGIPGILPIPLKCEHCGTQLVQTDMPLNGIPYFKGKRMTKKSI